MDECVRQLKGECDFTAWPVWVRPHVYTFSSKRIRRRSTTLISLDMCRSSFIRVKAVSGWRILLWIFYSSKTIGCKWSGRYWEVLNLDWSWTSVPERAYVHACERACVWLCVCVCVCVCVCERERERETDCMYVVMCVCETGIAVSAAFLKSKL